MRKKNTASKREKNKNSRRKASTGFHIPFACASHALHI